MLVRWLAGVLAGWLAGWRLVGGCLGWGIAYYQFM